MDVVYSVQQYVTRMTESVGGMKSLLLDKETTVIVSMVFSRSKVLEKQVFLFQRLDAERRGQMLHLKAIVFLRPTRENIDLLAKELRDPMFGEYHLFFSNVLSNDSVRTLAQADEFELVKQIHEYYADFYALTPTAFSLSLPSNAALTTPLADRTRDGLFALLLALKKKPAIRYQVSSHDAGRIAALLSQHIDQHQETMDFGAGRQDDVPPLLLILDRTDDPITPLLNQWTYQAMVHELLGIKNNLVELPQDLVAMPKGCQDSQSIVLSPISDEFYREIMYADFGSLHDSVQVKLEEFKKANPAMTQGANMSFKTIGEMQRFVEKYPQMHKMKDNVSKHVNLLQCLSKIVDRQELMAVSELEQQLACVQDHKGALKQLLAMLGGEGGVNYKVSDKDKMRLVMLYVLRYQKEASKGTLDQIKAMLPNQAIPGSFTPHVGAPEESMPAANKMPDVMLRVCGASQRTPQADLFNRGVTAVVSTAVKGLSKAQDNAYMMHEPLLARLLRLVDKGKLPEESHPYKLCSSHRHVVDAMRALKRGPSEIIVFIVGGGTYAEARVVHRFNEQNKHMRVILGATSMLTCHTFLQSVVAKAAGSRLAASP